ncbi:hypothetical protein ACIQCR_24110 [Streptomyces sp. NPDC093249]|uniref:hypothetical protein n=1 Tax=unclassified Streptomyces TaxID=2593676 RepID=UPI00344D4AD5
MSRVGPGGAAFLYGSAATLCLCGPLTLGAVLVAGPELLLMGIVFTVVLLPLGLALGGHTAAEREAGRRLDAQGIPATAEVTGLTAWEDGEDSGADVGLRISGPGFPPFETTWRRSSPCSLRVGLRLPAVVDPPHATYRVEI